MRLALVAVGRVSEPFIQEGCKVYAERIRRYTAFNQTLIPEERISSKGNIDHILRQEGRRIQEKLGPDIYCVALDERGKSLSSKAFAQMLGQWSCSGLKEIAFILGGPYGLDKAIREKANLCLSLSPMTLPHGMARMLLLEQIYRAFTLLRGEPYHK